MARQVSLDEMKDLRLVNDQPIRRLLLAEATSNLSLIFFTYFYPSTFLALFLKPNKQITPLTNHMLLWWTSWLVVITGLMYAAVPSKYNTPTLTAGLVHVRRFLYWTLLFSEVLLILLLLSPRHRTTTSIGFSIFLGLVILGRLIVLFPKQAWFGTVLVDSSKAKDE